MVGRRVLIIGINYAPEPTGIAPYTTGLAEHLAAAGAQVSVITGLPHYPHWRIPGDYDHNRHKSSLVNGVNILRRPHYVPAKASALNRSTYETTFLASAITALRGQSPDLVLGITPSISGAITAAIASRRFRVPYGIIFQDLAGPALAQSGLNGNATASTLTDKTETAVAKRANAVGIIAEGFRPHLVASGVHPSRIRRLRNWTHIANATHSKSETRARLGLPENAFIALHAGNMGMKQRLANVVEAARLASRTPDPVQFVLMGDGNQRQNLESLSAGIPNLTFLPPEPGETFPDALAAADILLVNQKPTVTNMCLPGKLTSYFSSGTPVVAAVAPDSETAREITAEEAGLVAPPGDPPALLDAIDQIRAHIPLGQTLARNAKAFALRELTPEAALAKYDQFVDDILAARLAPKLVTEPSGPAD